jgi:hypothetical protein
MFTFVNAGPLTASFGSRTAGGLRLDYGKLKRLAALSRLAGRKSPRARPITGGIRGTAGAGTDTNEERSVGQVARRCAWIRR